MDSNKGNELDRVETEPEKRHVQEVVRAAHSELRELLKKRTEIMQRIGSIKRTILGLASVFGSPDLSDEWLELKSRRRSSDQPGFTKTCRLVLMEAEAPLTAREICERVKARIEQIELRHKDPLASVTTVLNRLAEYGEAKIVSGENGRRAWQWIADTPGFDQKNETERSLAKESSPQNRT